MATSQSTAGTPLQPASTLAQPARKAVRKPAAPRKTSAAPKAVAASKLAPAKVAPPAPEKEHKAKKSKLVRDSFTIPKDEYAAIDALKLRAAALSHPAKKSELLRAGLKALAGMSDSALRAVLKAVPAIKTGRPKSDK